MTAMLIVVCWCTMRVGGFCWMCSVTFLSVSVSRFAMRSFMATSTVIYCLMTSSVPAARTVAGFVVVRDINT